jgi:hypothetical protein
MLTLYYHYAQLDGVIFQLITLGEVGCLGEFAKVAQK